MKKFIFYFTILGVGFLFAGRIGISNAVSFPEFSQPKDLPTLISSIYNFALAIVGIAVLIRFLQGGILWLTARGNPDQIKDAKSKIGNAVIGAILLSASYLILFAINPDLVKNTLKFVTPGINRLPEGKQMGLVTAPTKGPAQITGTPTNKTSFLDNIIGYAKAAGLYPFTMEVVDSNGDRSRNSYTIEILPNTGVKRIYKGLIVGGNIKKKGEWLRLVRAEEINTLSLPDINLPNGREGIEYYAEIPAQGGKPPYVYSIVEGSLPPGLKLEPSAEKNVDGLIGEFRYLKIETTEPGWVSWREVEAYDAAGNKISPVEATGSKGAWQPPNSGPEKAIDGNPNTAWNAGETNPACSVTYGPQCPASTRNAWFLVDFGSPKQISKIRLLENGDNYPEINKFSASNDGSSYTLIGQFSGVVRDNTWIEYPFPTNIPNPIASFTVNGEHEIEVPYGTLLLFDWSSTNGYGAFATFSYTIDPALPGYTYNNITTPCVMKELVNSSVTPFQIYNIPKDKDPNGILPLQSKDIPPKDRLGFIGRYIECFPKAVITYTYKVTSQYDLNKFAEDKVIIKIQGLPKNFDSGGILFGWESDQRVISINRGGSYTHNLVAFGKFYNPNLSALNLPSGVNISFGTWNNSVNDYPRIPVTVNAGTNAQPGFYIIRIQAEPGISMDLGLIIK